MITDAGHVDRLITGRTGAQEGAWRVDARPVAAGAEFGGRQRAFVDVDASFVVGRVQSEAVGTRALHRSLQIEALMRAAAVVVRTFVDICTKTVSITQIAANSDL